MIDHEQLSFVPQRHTEGVQKIKITQITGKKGGEIGKGEEKGLLACYRILPWRKRKIRDYLQSLLVRTSLKTTKCEGSFLYKDYLLLLLLLLLTCSSVSCPLVFLRHCTCMQITIRFLLVKHKKCGISLFLVINPLQCNWYTSSFSGLLRGSISPIKSERAHCMVLSHTFGRYHTVEVFVVLQFYPLSLFVIYRKGYG